MHLYQAFMEEEIGQFKNFNKISAQDFVMILISIKARLNILSLALSWALWCCLYRTHVIFNRAEPRLKTMWNTPSPPAPDPVGIENCKQLFSPLLAFTTQKIATHSTDIISAARIAFFGS